MEYFLDQKEKGMEALKKQGRTNIGKRKQKVQRFDRYIHIYI